MNDLYESKMKIRKIVSQLNQYIEKDYRCSNNPLLHNYFENFYNEKADKTNVINNELFKKENKTIEVQKSNNKIYSNSFDFNYENFSSYLNVIKKVNFHLLHKMIFKNNFCTKDFPLDFNLAIFSDLEKINNNSNKETFRKSIFILPMINFISIYFYHKHFGNFVRYKFSNYLKFSAVSSLIISAITVPIIKNYYIYQNLAKAKFNLNNILFLGISEDTKESLKFKSNILLNFPDIINEKDLYIKLCKFDNKINLSSKYHVYNNKSDVETKYAYDKQKLSFLDIYYFYNLRNLIKKEIYVNRNSNIIAEYRLFMFYFNNMILEANAKKYWSIQKRRIFLEIYLKQIKFEMKKDIEFINSNLKYKLDIKKIFNKKIKKKENKVSNEFESKEVDFIKNNFSKKELKKYKKVKLKNEKDLHSLNIYLKNRIWEFISKEYDVSYAFSKTEDENQINILKKNNRDKNVLLKNFNEYLELNSNNIGKISKENLSDIHSNQISLKLKTTIAIKFAYFNAFKKIKKGYSTIIEIKENAFYLDYLTRLEKDSVYVYSEFYKYLLLNKKMFFYLVNEFRIPNAEFKFLNKDFSKNHNIIDFTRLIFIINPNNFDNRYHNYLVYPFISSMILNYSFLKSYKYIIQLI